MTDFKGVMSPGNQTKNTQIVATKLGARLFRRNVGVAWIGEVVGKTFHAGTSRMKTITLKDPRIFNAGTKGECDSSGWKSEVITADMVGQKIARFVAVEDKQGVGRTGDDQERFIAAVRKAGGYAGVSRSDEDTAAILRGEIRD